MNFNSSCFSFRDKVIDLTGLNVLKIFEIILEEYDAQLFFFTSPNNQYQYFISSGNCNISAKNSMVHLLKKANYQKMSFICNANQSDHNNLKKCIEEAIRKLNSHSQRITAPLFSELEAKQGVCESRRNITLRKKPASVVDLTSDDSDPEDFLENLIEELDDDVYDEAFISGTSDSTPSLRYLEILLDWEENSNKCKEWKGNNEYEKTLIEHKTEDAYAFEHGFEPRKNLEKTMEEAPAVINKAPVAKISFSSGAIPSYARKKPQIIEARAMPSKDLQPRLNRGNTSQIIDLKPAAPKREIKSSILSPKEVVDWQKSGLNNKTHSALQEQSQLQRELLKNFKIPKHSDQSEAPKGPSSRKPIYTVDPDILEPSINPKANAALRVFQERVAAIKPYESPQIQPPSIQNFFPDDKTIAVHDEEDDEVTVIDESDDDGMEVDENQNCKVKKRGLFNVQDNDFKFLNRYDNPPAKFSKNRQPRAKQYKLNNVNKKGSKEDTTDFYNRDNSSQ